MEHVARAMEKYNLDIVTLQELRWKESGCIINIILECTILGKINKEKME